MFNSSASGARLFDLFGVVDPTAERRAIPAGDNGKCDSLFGDRALIGRHYRRSDKAVRMPDLTHTDELGVV
jgi:hypothetical protein